MIDWNISTVFNSNCQTITNTVNCKGVMGAGLALEFRLRFPQMFEEYKRACKNRDFRIGQPQLYKSDVSGKWIYNFPTKDDWKNPSKLEWIELGLKHFKESYKDSGIESIAFPKLGSSLGGLDWKIVRELMISQLEGLDILIEICLDEDRFASGIEAKMLDLLKQDICSDKQSELSRIVKKLDKGIVYGRFYEIQKKTGSSSYEKLFRYYYEMAISKIS